MMSNTKPTIKSQMRCYTRYGVAALLFIFSLLSSSGALADGFGWEFEEGKGRLGWMALRGDLAFSGGALHLTNANYPVLYSPPGLGFPQSATVFRIRLKSTKDGIGKVTLFAGGTAKGYSKIFHVSKGEGFRDYALYLGGLLPAGEKVHSIALNFQGAPVDIEIDSLFLVEPTRAELASIFWHGFWEPDRIRVGMSNSVKAPILGSVPFLILLYGVVVLVSVIIFIYYLAGKETGGLTPLNSLKALAAGFFVAAILFTVRMDYGWLRVWQGDSAELSALDANERLSVIYGGDLDTFFGFIEGMKRLVPEGETIRPAARPIARYEDHLARMVRYYALPLESSPSAKYLWVYYDQEDMNVTYDPAARTLTKGERLMVSGVVPVERFGNEAVLFKIVEDGKGGVRR